MFSLFFLLQANTPPANSLDIYLSKLVETKLVKTNLIIQETTNEESSKRIKIPPFIKKLFPKLTDLLTEPVKNLPILMQTLDNLFELFTDKPNFPEKEKIQEYLVKPLHSEISQILEREDNKKTLLKILDTDILRQPFANMDSNYLDDSQIIQNMVKTINTFTGTPEFKNTLLGFYKSYLKENEVQKFTDEIFKKIQITNTTYEELTAVEKSFVEILRFYTYAYLNIGIRRDSLKNRPRVKRLLGKLQDSIINQVVFTYLIYSYSVLSEDISI